MTTSPKPLKHYPLWQQFVDRQNEWVGGILYDEDADCSTPIKGIHIDRDELGDCFRVEGEEWDCSFSVEYGGIVPSGKPNTLRFYVPMSRMGFTITRP